MINQQNIVIPGEPLSLRRPRYNINNKFKKVYDPDALYKKNISKHMLSQRKTFFKSNSFLQVSFIFNFPFLLNSTEKKKNLSTWGKENLPLKKDIDNIIKLYLDSGNKILYDDDRNVVLIKATKRRSHFPRTEMKIVSIDEPKNKIHKILSIFSLDDVNEMLDIVWKIMEIKDCDELLECDSSIEKIALCLEEISQHFSHKFNMVLKS